MATTLWDTTGSDIVQALLAERRAAGALASGLALHLVVVVDEKQVREAEQAATIAAAAHPCRVLIVVRHSIEADTRLDAEVQVGGRLGATEAVVMRMYGRLALHAESVVLPLLAPDAPVVTWWHGAPPDEIATDALGVLASRRVTDCAQSPDPMAALRQRAEDFVAGRHRPGVGPRRRRGGRCSPRRSTASMHAAAAPRSRAEAGNPSAALLSGWLAARGSASRPTVEETPRPGITRRRAADHAPPTAEDYPIRIERPDGRSATLSRGGEQPRALPLPRRELGDLLAEELRRMDPDPVYAEALASGDRHGVDEHPARQDLGLARPGRRGRPPASRTRIMSTPLVVVHRDATAARPGGRRADHHRPRRRAGGARRRLDRPDRRRDRRRQPARAGGVPGPRRDRLGRGWTSGGATSASCRPVTTDRNETQAREALLDAVAARSRAGSTRCPPATARPATTSMPPPRSTPRSSPRRPTPRTTGRRRRFDVLLLGRRPGRPRRVAVPGGAGAVRRAGGHPGARRPEAAADPALAVARRDQLRPRGLADRRRRGEGRSASRLALSGAGLDRRPSGRRQGTRGDALAARPGGGGPVARRHRPPCQPLSDRPTQRRPGPVSRSCA